MGFIITTSLADIPVHTITSIESDLKSNLIKKQSNINHIPVRTTPKINRNELCPCGSGIKYKKCCINGKIKF